MDRNTATLLLLLSGTAALLTLPPAEADHDSLSSAGTKFVVGFANDRDSTLELHVSTPESHVVTFTVKAANVETSYTVTASSTQSVSIDSMLTTVEVDQDQENGILVSSDDGVSKLVVKAFIAIADLAIETFTVFPPHHYPSYTYFGLSTQLPPMEDDKKSFLLLVGVENETRVTITPTQEVDIPAERRENGCPAMLESGSTCTVVLQPLNTLLLANTLDLTGTKIVSDKPLSVFSGHECHIPQGVGSCEPLVEQIPPIATWGKAFLVGPLEDRHGPELYKVVAAEASTAVSVYCVEEDNTDININLSFQLPREGSALEFPVGSTRLCSIRADKPILVVLMAPNVRIGIGEIYDGAFMALVAPVNQYINSITITMLSSGAITATIPAEFCPNAQCSLLVNETDITSVPVPIHCSVDDVCAYAVTSSLPAGVQRLKLADTSARMGLTSYTLTVKSGYGTITGMDLNHIAVYRPDVVITHNGHSQDGSPLVAGGRLTLTCTVRIEEELSEGIYVSARWLQGEGQEEISSGLVVEVQNENDAYQLEHSFETLSVADSSRYTCEASLSSHHAGVLATAAQSIDITVEDPVTFGYFQLLFEGVTKCRDWMLSETAEKADQLREEVAGIIRQHCSCNFPAEFISSPTLQCPAANPDSSNEVLFRAQVQMGGANRLSYSDMIVHLEEARDTSFSFKGLLLTVSPDLECSVKIDSLRDAPCSSETTPPPCSSTADTGGVSSDNAESSSANVATIATSVTVAGVVIIVGAVIVAVVIIAMTRRHGNNNNNQRPKSIHLHQRMASGESVISFSPGLSDIYTPPPVQTLNPISKSASQNGFSNAAHQSPAEQEAVEIVKEDLSKIRPPSVSFSDV